jgi:hypothetical protein
MAKKNKSKKSHKTQTKRRVRPAIEKDSQTIIPSIQEQEQRDGFDLKSLARLAENVWRLEGRARRANDSTSWADPVIERLNDDLRELGVEIIDRLGTPYRDGETMEKVHSDAPADWSGPLVVTEVISPPIRIGGKIIEHGKVVVGPQVNETKEQDHAG